MLDVEQWRLMGEEITRSTIDFMRRQVKAGKPFYDYVSFSLVHMPSLLNPEFVGRTGNGDWADSLAEMDHHTGQIVDAIKELQLECLMGEQERSNREGVSAWVWIPKRFFARLGNMTDTPWVPLRWG